MKNVKRAVVLFPRNAAIFLVELYRRFISPRTLPTCRFVPTCSEYALTALKKHGFVRGGWLAIKRISRCHPWGKSGFDPVP
jgi:putative membrane protein insertion efficiency factor